MVTNSDKHCNNKMMFALIVYDLQGNMTFSAWRTVFLTGAGVYAFGTAVYIALIQAKPQPWNYREDKEKQSSTDTC